MDLNIVSSFFSTGAQASAAITALTATFAVIRAQSLALELERRAKVAYTEFSNFSLLSQAILKEDNEQLVEAATYAEKMDVLARKFGRLLHSKVPAQDFADLLAASKYQASSEQIDAAMIRWKTWANLLRRFLAVQTKSRRMRGWAVATTVFGSIAVFTGVVGVGIEVLVPEEFWAPMMDAYLVLLALCLFSGIGAVRGAFREG